MCLHLILVCSPPHMRYTCARIKVSSFMSIMERLCVRPRDLSIICSSSIRTAVSRNMCEEHSRIVWDNSLHIQVLNYWRKTVIRARCLLTHWGRDNMAAIFQTTFSNAFSWMKMFKFRLRFHPRVQLTIFQHWFRLWLGAGQATSHYLNQWWSVYWRIYASLGLKVNPYII